MKRYFIQDSDMWQQISDDVTTASGIYLVRSSAAESNDSSYFPIHRVGNVDSEGILYIGAASVLRDRLADLRKAVCAAFKFGGYVNPYSHPVGAHLFKYSILKDKFPLNSLCVTIKVVSETCDNPYAIFNEENAALNNYARGFGELPPFNIAPGGRVLPDVISE